MWVARNAWLLQSWGTNTSGTWWEPRGCSRPMSGSVTNYGKLGHSSAKAATQEDTRWPSPLPRCPSLGWAVTGLVLKLRLLFSQFNSYSVTWRTQITKRLDSMLYTLSLLKKQNFLPLLKFTHSSSHLAGFPSSCNWIVTLTSTHLTPFQIPSEITPEPG